MKAPIASPRQQVSPRQPSPRGMPPSRAAVAAAAAPKSPTPPFAYAANPAAAAAAAQVRGAGALGCGVAAGGVARPPPGAFAGGKAAVVAGEADEQAWCWGQYASVSAVETWMLNSPGVMLPSQLDWGNLAAIHWRSKTSMSLQTRLLQQPSVLCCCCVQVCPVTQLGSPVQVGCRR